jgi:hypothetical protein
VRRLVQRAGVCACVSTFLLTVAPAAAVSQRRVTFAVSGSGKAFWKLDSKSDTGRLSLRYRWHGTIGFDVPRARLRDPRHRGLTVAHATTLSASWSGTYRGRRSGVLTTCTYSGSKVRAAVVARIAAGRSKGTLELTFHPRTGNGFFRDRGGRARVRCGSGKVAQSAPLHFAPSWFFRDNLQDHGRLTSQNAVLVLPGTLLPRGSATISFPLERGSNDSVALGHLGWNNRGTTSVQTH